MSVSLQVGDTPRDRVCDVCGCLIKAKRTGCVQENGSTIAYICPLCLGDPKAAMSLLRLQRVLAGQLWEILEGLHPIAWKRAARLLRERPAG